MRSDDVRTEAARIPRPQRAVVYPPPRSHLVFVSHRLFCRLNDCVSCTVRCSRAMSHALEGPVAARAPAQAEPESHFCVMMGYLKRFMCAIPV